MLGPRFIGIAAVAVLGQETAAGRVVEAGVHVVEAGGRIVDGAGKFDVVFKEGIAGFFCPAVFVVFVAFDSCAVRLEDAGDAAADIVVVEEEHVVVGTVEAFGGDNDSVYC